MAIRVNPQLIDELARYGAEDVHKCYHCGNCSAVCPHSEEPFVLPRKVMRHLQMGLERKLESALDPWLCYYCGQCTEECPREAEPGETMMSLRRWLTSRYDFTGISRLFYRSWAAELTAITVVALATGIGLYAWGSTHGDITVYDGPGAFLPSSAIHVFDWTMAGVLTLLLAVNAARMWYFTVGRQGLAVPLGTYVKQAWLLPVHFVTQLRYARCGKKSPWAIHLGLMLSYVTMFVLIMFFLHEMQAGPEIRWQVHAFGYAASAGLVGTIGYALHGRLRRTHTHYRHSHESDWIFLLLLAAVVVTGIAQHVLHRAGLPLYANVAYLVHLMGVVPMLLVEVPFSKWSHLAYRPLAIYLAALQRDALTVPAGAHAPARGAA